MLNHLRPDDVTLRSSFSDGRLNVLVLRVRPDVDGGRIKPHEEGLIVFSLPVEVVERFGENFRVEGFHTLTRERSGIFDLLLADTPKLWIFSRIINGGCHGIEYAAGTNIRCIFRVLLARIIKLLWLFF